MDMLVGTYNRPGGVAIRIYFASLQNDLTINADCLYISAMLEQQAHYLLCHFRTPGHGATG
jgi:hypothetical protein